MNDFDIVNKLRMYAEALHSTGGFNGYASAMSLAADEIVKLREYARTIEEDLVATIDQRDELEQIEAIIAKNLTITDQRLMDGVIGAVMDAVNAEREACAKVAELVAREIDDTNGTATYIAKAIRARGNAE